MNGRRRGATVLRTLVTSALVIVGWATRADATPKGENVHQPETDCAPCHARGHAALQDNPAARTQLVPDVDDRCTKCHDDEGPSHHVGIKPQRPVPEILPLSDQGLIICSTCHFVHGEHTPNSNFERIDNSRGALCLTCHELSELQ